MKDPVDRPPLAGRHGVRKSTAGKNTVDVLNRWPKAAAFQEARALEPCRRADFGTANAGQDRVGGLFGLSGHKIAFSCRMTPRAKPVSSSGRRRERRAAAQMRGEGRSGRAVCRFMDGAVLNKGLRAGVLKCVHVYRYTDTRFSCEPGNEAGVTSGRPFYRGPATRWEYLMRLASLRKKSSS